MSLSVYMDEHVPSAITQSLWLRGIDVLTAQQDGRERTADNLLMDRATELGRLIFSRDQDMLRHANEFQCRGHYFSGVIFASQREVSIGQCVDDLSLICLAGSAEEFCNRVTYLPFR